MVWVFASLISFFLPGFFLTKILFSSKKVSLALYTSLITFFSLAVIPAFFFLISLIKPIPLTTNLTLIITLTLSLFLFLVSKTAPRPKAELPTKKEAVFLLVLIFLSLVLLLAPYLRPHLGPFWSTYHFDKGRDIHERIAVIVGLKKLGLPPKNPDIFGEPLNYYYFYHLNVAILSVSSNEVVSSELSHLFLSASILIASSLLLSVLFHPLICLTLLLGYGFDFFPMIAILLKIRPYQFGLNHIDEWTAPFAPQLKVNPLSVWFAWVPHHTLALFLFLIFLGIFFEQIEIKKSLKSLALAFLTFAICGTSGYVFLGGLVIFFLFIAFKFFQGKLILKDYAFLALAFPFCLIFLLPMALRIKVPTIAPYPFWQLPRDHLLWWKFPPFPLTIKFILLVFFLIERFFVYFFDLGLLFVLAILSWKKVPKNDFFNFSKIMLVVSVLVAIFLKSVPANNDLGYRISGFTWLACAFLVNQQVEKFWKKIKKKLLLLLVLVVIVFSPTIIEQFIFPYQKIGRDFWQMKDFVNQNIPEDAVVQTPPDYSPAGIYLLERKIVYSNYGWLFYPDKEKTEKIAQEVKIIFEGDVEESCRLIKKYKIDYILVKAPTELKSAIFFEKAFENKSFLIYKTGI